MASAEPRSRPSRLSVEQTRDHLEAELERFIQLDLCPVRDDYHQLRNVAENLKPLLADYLRVSHNLSHF